MPGIECQTPGLAGYLKTIKHSSTDHAIEQLVSLLKRRQIRGSKQCAIATTHLLLRIVGAFKGRDIPHLTAHVDHAGSRLISAQPLELVIGNIVQRVLGLIKEVTEDESDNGASDAGSSFQGSSPKRPVLTSSISPLKGGAEADDLFPTSSPHEAFKTKRPTLITSYTSFITPTATSLFGIFSGPANADSGFSTPTGTRSPVIGTMSPSMRNLDTVQALKEAKPEILDGIREMLDELDQASEQIAAYALDHIHSNEVILTHGASATVRKFLLAAAKKRKFTVLHVEGEPNDSVATRNMMFTGSASGTPGAEEDESLDDHHRSLTSMGCTVVSIPDSLVSMIMPRVNKVLLAPFAVLQNGAVIASGGVNTLAAVAQMHRVPVVILSGVYKLSPAYPLNVDGMLEVGGAGPVVGTDGEWENVDVSNPMWDYVPASNINLYMTNLGAHAPSYLHRIIGDHYNLETMNFFPASLSCD